MKPQSDLHSTEEIPWTPIGAGASSAKGEGITEKILSIDPDNPNNCTRLVKLEKGVRTGVVSHPFWEEVWILKGTLIDEGNKVTGKEGYYCCRHPDMQHGPFYVPEECITVELHYTPKEGWDGKPQSDLHSTEEIPWTPIRTDTSSSSGAGMTEKILSVDPNNPDSCTRLIKQEPGFKSTGIMVHTFWEELFVIKGTLIDEGNKVVGKEGAYCCRQPGMLHGPIDHPDGAFLLEFRYMPQD